jgi:hypothetical protein
VVPAGFRDLPVAAVARRFDIAYTVPIFAGGYQSIAGNTVERKGGDRPACVLGAVVVLVP